MSTVTIGLADARNLAIASLSASNTSVANATVVAEALVLAEADGLSSHGLSRLPAYAEQAIAGKVDGHAVPEIRRPRPAGR